MAKRDSNRPVFELPPDSEPSEALLSSILYYKRRGMPLLYLARMRRMPYGFLLYVKSKYLD